MKKSISEYYQKLMDKKKPVIQSQKESEREALIQEYKRLQMLEKQHYNSTSDYKIVFLILTSGLLIGCFGLLLWMAGRKSGRNSCKC